VSWPTSSHIFWYFPGGPEEIHDPPVPFRTSSLWAEILTQDITSTKQGQRSVFQFERRLMLRIWIKRVMQPLNTLYTLWDRWKIFHNLFSLITWPLPAAMFRPIMPHLGLTTDYETYVTASSSYSKDIYPEDGGYNVYRSRAFNNNQKRVLTIRNLVNIQAEKQRRFCIFVRTRMTTQSR
jgi:hypothetical protein